MKKYIALIGLLLLAGCGNDDGDSKRPLQPLTSLTQHPMT